MRSMIAPLAALTLIAGPAARAAPPGPAEMVAITALAASPDGRVVASGGRDGRVRLWEARAGAPIRTLRGHEGQIEAIAFAPDGKTLASGSTDQVVCLWDAATGERLRTMKGRVAYRLSALAFAPDGREIAVGDQVGAVTFWDVATGAAKHTVPGRASTVEALAYAPDGKILAVAGQDKTVTLRDARTAAPLRKLGHGGIVWSIAFLDAGKTLATASEDGKIRLWDVEAGTLRRVLFTGHLPARHLAASPDGGLLIARALGELKAWDARTWREVAAPKEVGDAGPLAVAPDGRALFTGNGYTSRAVGLLRAYDLPAGTLRWEAVGYARRVIAVAFAPDGRTIAAGVSEYVREQDWFSESGHVELRDARTGAVRQTLARPARSLAFAPDGKALAVGFGNAVELWDPATGETRPILKGGDLVGAVAFAPDGRALAAGFGGSTLRPGEVIVRGLAAGGAAWTGSVGNSSVTAVDFSPDGRTVATGSVEHRHARGGPSEVRLWDAATGRLLRTIEGDSDGARALAFAPDGRSLAAAFWTGGVILWDLRPVVPRQVFKDRITAGAMAVAFSADGGTVAAGGFRSRNHLERPGTVKTWDAATGAPKRSLATDADPASSPAFAADLSAIAIGRDDGTITRLELTPPDPGR